MPNSTLPMARGSLPLTGRTLVMGIVNVTPDSFSDGGNFAAEDAAVEQGLRLAAEGADILDIGGESTRPGSDPVSEEDELARVIPVIERLAAQCDAAISIDTYKAEVAWQAVLAGANIINDISALRGDPAMAEVAARTGAALVLMHMKGEPKTMQANPVYADVVAEVREFLLAQAGVAMDAGVERDRIVLDPGIGFGKNLEHNLALIRHLDKLAEPGFPLLLGASRKAFIGTLTGRQVPAERLWGTVGVHVLGAALGARIVRVHDVAPVAEALKVSDAVMNVGAA